MGKSYEELRSIFKKLGAKDPKSWAQSEINEGFPQLARFVFLRQAWEKCVIREDDPSWIGLKPQHPGEHPGDSEHPDEPCGGRGAALNRLLMKGIDPKDLLEVILAGQYESLFALCYLLSDPGGLEPEIADVAWKLFEVDEEGQPNREMGGLHESVLSMDPTGREMRPKRKDD